MQLIKDSATVSLQGVHQLVPAGKPLALLRCVCVLREAGGEICACKVWYIYLAQHLIAYTVVCSGVKYLQGSCRRCLKVRRNLVQACHMGPSYCSDLSASRF